jgi:hypothetical protein
MGSLKDKFEQILQADNCQPIRITPPNIPPQSHQSSRISASPPANTGINLCKILIIAFVVGAICFLLINYMNEIHLKEYSHNDEIPDDTRMVPKKRETTRAELEILREDPLFQEFDT